MKNLVRSFFQLTVVFLTFLLGAVVVPVVGSSPASASEPATYTLSSDPSGLTYAVSFGDTYLAINSSTTLTVTVTNTSTGQPVAGQNIGQDIGQGAGFSGWTFAVTNSSGVATFDVTMQSSSVLTVFLENYSQPSQYAGAYDYFSTGFMAAGQYLQIHLAQDTTCPSGSYLHSGACTQAGPGHYATGGTSSVLGSCAAGYYQSLIAQSSCLPADVGYYVPFSQATAQLPAPVGSFVAVTGASAPSVCPIESTTTSTGQSACVSTAHNVTYAPGTGSGSVPSQSAEGTGGTFSVAANSLTNPGFNFAGWFDGASTYQPGSTYTVGTSDVTLTALWTAQVPPIVYSKPTAPSGVAVTMSSGNALVSFSPGSSGNLPTYDQIDMYINGQLFGNVCNVSGVSSCPISNLGPDVTFSFTVTAINSKGSAVSALSNSVSYTSPSFALPTTTTTTVPPVMKTITCLKGAITKKVTALNPVCPAGYKKK